jgi:hypothetical protein
MTTTSHATSWVCYSGCKECRVTKGTDREEKM